MIKDNLKTNEIDYFISNLNKDNLSMLKCVNFSKGLMQLEGLCEYTKGEFQRAYIEIKVSECIYQNSEIIRKIKDAFNIVSKDYSKYKCLPYTGLVLYME